MDSSISLLLEAVDADKAKLDAARPLPPHTLASLRCGFNPSMQHT
ncbi:hypothetical protein [Burkholderia lata]|nr:hypothetical protein [Burkholderia lata]